MQKFGRTDLKAVVDDGGNYQEIEVNWVNPRLLHRKIISDLEDNNFTIKEEEDSSIDIESELVGGSTGNVTARIRASKEFLEVGEIYYNPFKEYVSKLLVLSILSGFLSILFITEPEQLLGILRDIMLSDLFYAVKESYGAYIILLTAIFFVGYYKISKYKKIGEFPVNIRNTLKILIMGEVTEQKTVENGKEVSELQSQLTISIGSLSSITAIEVECSKDTGYKNPTNVIKKYNLEDANRNRYSEEILSKDKKIYLELEEVEPLSGYYFSIHKSKIFVNRLLSDSGREIIIKEEQIMHEVVKDLLDKISKKASETKSQFGKEKTDEW